MREIRQSGSEGGVALRCHPYPYQRADGCGEQKTVQFGLCSRPR
jgi:hypothetical protein